MDSFAEIAVFTRVVDLGGFTKAAANLGLTPSGVSRIIRRLEERLGAQLLHRTTRSLNLTDEGATYYERCTRILADLEDANTGLAKASAKPRGRLRVELPIALADYVIGPALPRFLEMYPEVALDVTVRDRVIDPTAEGIDVAVRLAPTRDSELVSKRLAPARSILVASPKYLAKHGTPKSMADLREHSCIAYLSSTGPLPWRLKVGTGEVSFAARGRLLAGSGNILTHAAAGGLGIAQTFEVHVAAELRRGDLVTVLDTLEPSPRVVHALYAKQRAALPKVKVFLGFLADVFAQKAARKAR